MAKLMRRLDRITDVAFRVSMVNILVLVIYWLATGVLWLLNRYAGTMIDTSDVWIGFVPIGLFALGCLATQVGALVGYLVLERIDERRESANEPTL